MNSPQHLLVFPACVAVDCAEPCEAQPTVGGRCASYRQHNLRVWDFAEIA
ncbi:MULTISPECIES: hypothetical protein [unclassified Thiocapsa]